MKKIKYQQPTKRQFIVGFFVVVALLAGIKYLTKTTPEYEENAQSTLYSHKPNRILSVP